MTDKTNIYWIAMSSGPLTEDKMRLLKSDQYDVVRSRSKLEFEKEFQISASENNIIVVSEESYTPNTGNILLQIFEDPLYDGSRIIYCYSNQERNAIEDAVLCGAKDIIPLTASSARWINKFKFATGTSTNKFPIPDFQVTSREHAKIELPSRLVWINEDHLCLNTDYCPKVGDRVDVTSKINNQMNLENFEVRVVEASSENMTYRYGNTVICRWAAEDEIGRIEKRNVLNRVKDVGHPLRQNIYLGIYSKKIRNKLIEKFDRKQFHVHCSANILNMLDEIKFLKPQFILLDGRTFAKAKSLIPKIKSTAGEGVYIYLFGLKLSEELKEKLKKTNNIYCYEKIPLLIENSILKKTQRN